MSKFECPVVCIGIEPHPNADALEIATVGGYKSVVKKGQFKNGELAIYLPEAAVLPEWLLKHLGFWDDAKGCGKLNGAYKNRIGAMKLRGVLSQGILLKCRRLHPFSMRQRCAIGELVAVEGDDLSEHLGVTKYEPSIPSCLQGRVNYAGLTTTCNYDIEDIKKTPDLFVKGERVVLTEKIHGTHVQICLLPESMASEKFYKGRVTVTSKNLSGKGYVLDHKDDSSVYIQVVKKFGLLDKMFGLSITSNMDKPIILFGEVFGKGVQDLEYGDDLQFRAFDVCEGFRGDMKFLNYWEFFDFCSEKYIPMAPVLYNGPFSNEILQNYTNGKECVSGENRHLREGVVIKNVVEEGDDPALLTRKIAKSVSEAYLLRKGNTTEFQ